MFPVQPVSAPAVFAARPAGCVPPTVASAVVGTDGASTSSSSHDVNSTHDFYSSNGGAGSVAVGGYVNSSPAGYQCHPQPQRRPVVAQNTGMHPSQRQSTEASGGSDEQSPSGKRKLLIRHVLLIGGGSGDTKSGKTSEDNIDTINDRKMPKAASCVFKKSESAETVLPDAVHSGLLNDAGVAPSNQPHANISNYRNTEPSITNRKVASHVSSSGNASKSAFIPNGYNSNNMARGGANDMVTQQYQMINNNANMIHNQLLHPPPHSFTSYSLNPPVHHLAYNNMIPALTPGMSHVMMGTPGFRVEYGQGSFLNPGHLHHTQFHAQQILHNQGHHHPQLHAQQSLHNLGHNHPQLLAQQMPNPGTFVANPAKAPADMTRQPALSDGASKECCSINLCPAEIPRDPLDDDWEKTSPLEKEMAWLLEESQVFLPPSANQVVPEKLPIVLDFAWRHGSLELREFLWKTFPPKVSLLMKKLQNGERNSTENSDTRLTLVDGADLLRAYYHGIENHHVRDRFRLLRKEARQAIQLGYRRSESIERELGEIHGFRWREAVEEVGEPGANKNCMPAMINQPRHRRKRIRNAELLKRALGQDRERDNSSKSQSAKEAEAIASQIPSELTPIEEEVAWLTEESLILLPADMVDPKNAGKQSEAVISAGLVTKSCEIKWDYVVANATELLSEELKRIGGIKRRPLQRIIRYHDKEVRDAFQKRRDVIASLLILQGYRRKQTEHSLPSPELLKHTGLDKVMAVKLMRRRQNDRIGETVSKEDLRSACNARIGDKDSKSPQRPSKRKSNCTNSPPKKKSKALKPALKLSATQKVQSSVLTPAEEEIAWLREEYELETGVKCYDWEYIEKSSSLPLLIEMAEKSVPPSSFPSVAGRSKLQTMVRLDIPNVKEAFEMKRRGIRYAITQMGFRRDRSKHLPDIPPAPTSSDSPTVRKNGTSVLNIEYTDEYKATFFEDSTTENQSEENSLSGEIHESKDDGSVDDCKNDTKSSLDSENGVDTDDQRGDELAGNTSEVKCSPKKSSECKSLIANPSAVKSEGSRGSDSSSADDLGIKKEEPETPIKAFRDVAATNDLGIKNEEPDTPYNAMRDVATDSIDRKKEERTPSPECDQANNNCEVDSSNKKEEENDEEEVSDSSESYIEFEDESEEEVKEDDDDEYEVSSEESEDDDLIEDCC